MSSKYTYMSISSGPITHTRIFLTQEYEIGPRKKRDRQYSVNLSLAIQGLHQIDNR